MDASKYMIDFGLFLKNYDIIEATDYLARQDVLLGSEIVRVREMKSKQEIIDYLNKKLQKPDRIQKALIALTHFSADTYRDFQQNLTRFENLQTKTVTKPINKEKSVTSEETFCSSQWGESATSSSNSSSSNEDQALSSSKAESTETLPTASQKKESYFTVSSQATLLSPTDDSGICTVTSIKKKGRRKPHKSESQKLLMTPVYLVLTALHNCTGGSVTPDQVCSHLPPYSLAKEGNPQQLNTFPLFPTTDQISQFKELLVEYREELMDCMDVPTLLKYLFKEKLVTYEEYGILVNEKLPRERNRYLLSILPSKGHKALDRFIKCLKAAKEHLAHPDLAKKLEDRMMLPSSDV